MKEFLRVHRIVIGLATVVVVGAIVVAGAYLHEREAKVRVEARVDQRATDTAAQVKPIDAAIKAVKTPKQAVAALNSGTVIHLPAQLRMLETQSSPVPSENIRELPAFTKNYQDLPSCDEKCRSGVTENSNDVIVPAPDVEPLYRAIAEGKKCAVELTACTADRQDLQGVVRGGNWAQRAVKNPKLWFAIGAAAGGFVVHELRK